MSDAGVPLPGPPPPPRTGGAYFVAAGILVSRLAGLVRVRVFAHYLGASAAADAFNAAMRIPNLLQNLFGEGALSAAFIGVYAALRGRGEDERAERVASAVGTLLALLVAILVATGVALAPLLVALIAPGFTGEKRELTVQLVRILFPGIGLLVLSAWCLGILNSHRRFFLSYAAPVLWNAAIIAALLAWGGRSSQAELAVAAAWGAVAGSLLQLAVQLPAVLSLLRGFRPRLELANPDVRTVARNFAPVLLSRGVVQVSSFIDEMIASLLPTGALAFLGYAQQIYLLPISLFGMSVSAAELPEMAGAAARAGNLEDAYAALRGRLEASTRQLAFYVVPSAFAFIVFGDLLAGALFQTGAFVRRDAVYVWGILAGFAVGLVATTAARLYASAFYALADTRTPVRVALLRVTVAVAAGWGLALHAPRLLGIDMRWGVAGLALASGASGWLELTLLRRRLRARIGGVPAWRVLGIPLPAALAAAAAALAVRWFLAPALPPDRHPILLALAVTGAFAGVYVGIAALRGEPEVAKLRRRFRR